jgi:hypothetical protein
MEQEVEADANADADAASYVRVGWRPWPTGPLAACS